MGIVQLRGAKVAIAFPSPVACAFHAVNNLEVIRCILYVSCVGCAVHLPGLQCLHNKAVLKCLRVYRCVYPAVSYVPELSINICFYIFSNVSRLYRNDECVLHRNYRADNGMSMVQN